ncbi:hypothetical protein Godav_023138 [Gossypium davidsonii]|uniref:Uncharacterized protein n=1 Tax=Gossypium davidsonii TaxID=34287 RepID=A0A7J8SR61_GOSDV|nr:hypothetical protein [Gossypium davidsonii]
MRRNTVEKLIDSNGIVHDSNEGLLSLATRYFESLFSSNGIANAEAILEGVESCITAFFGSVAIGLHKGALKGVYENRHAPLVTHLLFADESLIFHEAMMEEWLAGARRCCLYGVKEVLIKAVLQATPLYAMSCFLLPSSLCKKLEAMITRWRVGPRHSISIWNDFWLPRHNQVRIVTILVLSLNRVSDLRLPDSSGWNHALISRTFSDKEARKIVSILIPQTNQFDNDFETPWAKRDDQMEPPPRWVKVNVDVGFLTTK